MTGVAACRRAIGIGCGIATLVFASCALPGKSYPVSPELRGTLRSGDARPADGRIILSIHYLENPVLGERITQPLRPDGSWRFDPVLLPVAGKEYSKRYRLYLDWDDGDATRVLWRAEYARTEIDRPVQLDCDLTRTPRQGQVCWVANPRELPWLVDAGRRDFERLCSTCHGQGGLGDGPTSIASGAVPPDLTTIARRRGGTFPHGEIAEWIDGRDAPRIHGTRSMPVWGEPLERNFDGYSTADELAGARIDTLVTFIETIQESE
jgi:hypothetical protein